MSTLNGLPVEQVIRIFFLAIVSFLAAFLLAPMLIRFLIAHRLGKQIRDSKLAPIFAKLHKNKTGTPTMGGILVWGTTLIVVLLLWFFARIDGPFFNALNFFSRSQTYLPLAAFGAAAVIGLVDDLFNIYRIGPNGGGLRMRHRLILYAVIALTGALWFYFKLDWDVLHIPFWGNLAVGAWYIPIFMFIIIATGFSVNQTDGLDGLAGGVLLAAFGAYAAIAFILGRYELAAFLAVIIGALTVFIWYNIYPAKFFMGDTGSMSMGVTLGVVAMLTNYALLLPVIGAVLVIEALSTLIQIGSRKLRQGKKVFLVAPIHHHLEAKGWPEPNVVFRLWLIAGFGAMVGVILMLLDRGVGIG
ncbi:phospho-N-acetylmuramoyl-pentapeptide-transferase [Candidatus Uhrbacteria bacterium]|nr:phospho-N-acetylmuramoyl-pentapeptide-transferase [Candidatus Uhrbacteria bacterium]